ncbi:MAG: hypothetical protein P4L87_14510 [Formivibrio sp.]|nr:hypothetical protein [Formivibrio sp.]
MSALENQYGSFHATNASSCFVLGQIANNFDQIGASIVLSTMQYLKSKQTEHRKMLILFIQIGQEDAFACIAASKQLIPKITVPSSD